MIGLSTSGSISLGIALVHGRKRVPKPAAAMTALRTFGLGIEKLYHAVVQLTCSTIITVYTQVHYGARGRAKRVNDRKSARAVGTGICDALGCRVWARRPHHL